MLAQPVFFEDGDWVAQPRDWAPNTVSGTGCDLAVGEGRRIWEACQARAAGLPLLSPLAADAAAAEAISAWMFNLAWERLRTQLRPARRRRAALWKGSNARTLGRRSPSHSRRRAPSSHAANTRTACGRSRSMA